MRIANRCTSPHTSEIRILPCHDRSGQDLDKSGQVWTLWALVELIKKLVFWWREWSDRPVGIIIDSTRKWDVWVKWGVGFCAANRRTGPHSPEIDDFHQNVAFSSRIGPLWAENR